MYVYGVYANGLKLYASTLLLLAAIAVAIIAIVAVVVTVIDELYIFQVSKMPHELNSFRIRLFAQYMVRHRKKQSKNTRKWNKRQPISVWITAILLVNKWWLHGKYKQNDPFNSINLVRKCTNVSDANSSIDIWNNRMNWAHSILIRRTHTQNANRMKTIYVARNFSSRFWRFYVLEPRIVHVLFK